MRTRITLILLATILAALNSPGVFAQDENEKLTSPILLNHFYFVLDSATYVSIESSSFLRNEFAITEKRTTVRQGGNSYTGLYFYGENTYFEFFNIATEKNNKAGNTGIAFGIEQPNALNALQQLIVGESTKLSPATRELDGNQIPWFFSIGPKGFPSRY
ncbi:MAG: hypothetical protein GY863_07895, partial [bacterium]|nr:hypothetical protein [bacterium]